MEQEQILSKIKNLPLVMADDTPHENWQIAKFLEGEVTCEITKELALESERTVLYLMLTYGGEQLDRTGAILDAAKILGRPIDIFIPEKNPDYTCAGWDAEDVDKII